MSATAQKIVNRPAMPVVARQPVQIRSTPGVAQFAGSLKISSPSDPAEREAEHTAKRIMRMPLPQSESTVTAKCSPHAARFANTIRQSEPPRIARKQEGNATTSSSVASEISASQSSGNPLPTGVRKFMEPRFNADFSQVRIHTGDKAAKLNRKVSAQAFTVGKQVFFGKNRFRPESNEGRELIAHELTHTVQQGAVIQRSVDTPAITQRSPSLIQRGFLSALGIDLDPRKYFAEKAAAIPGFTMLTVIIGFNPISGESVDRSAGNILKGAIEMIPVVGVHITSALNNHGIFDKVSAWAAGQFKALSDIGSSIKQSVTDFIKDFDITSPLKMLARGKQLINEPITRIKNFAINLKNDIITFIKDAILKPIAAFAKANAPNGYDLLCGVLGKDPISGDPVPRTAETLVAPFMKLIGQEEVWENMKKANAIPRAWAWFQSNLAAVKGFVQEVPGLFIAAFKSLEIMDIVLIPKAFAKLVKVFGGFVGKFITWAGNAVWNLLEIIFDSLKPGLMGYIKKTGAALKSILKNPLPFVGNLVKAAKLGFQNFGANFGTHLKAGLIDWLTGSLSGVYIPKALSLPELGKFAMSVLGITWAQIRGKIVKALGANGEMIMKGLETAFDIVKALVTGGPAAAWELIKDKLASLKDTVVSGIVSFVITTVITKAVPKLIAMFIPGAGFIPAAISIYDTIMVFVQKISKIIQVVVAFIDSIVAIAGGNITAAAKRVESILAGLLSLAISFLAGFLGLGKITDKIKGVIEKVHATVDKFLDAAINWIVTKAKSLFGKLFGGKDKKGGLDPEVQKKLDAGLAAIDAAEAPLRKDGKLAEEDAQKVAASIKSAHPVFKSMKVIQMGDHWQYEYVVNPPGSKAGAKTGVKSHLGATRIGKDKTKFKGSFNDPAWNWTGLPTSATPHPANVWAKSSNSSTIPYPSGTYTVTGAGTAGNISTAGWRQKIDKEKNKEKARLQKLNPKQAQEDPAKAVIEQRYSMGWLDLYLINPWDQHHIQPINWKGKNNTKNMQYLRRQEHSPITSWWTSRKADIIANI